MRIKLFTSITICCLAISGIFYVSSCKKDKCKDVTCQNGGVCNDGTCGCVNGYTGATCQIAPDPCASTTCENGGTCVSGVCDCATGYEGTNCEDEVRGKFLGTYFMDGSYNCSIGGNMTLTGHPIFIMSGSSILEVSLNIGGATPLTATVNGTTLTVPTQTSNGKTYSGNGNINANVLTLNVTELNPSNGESCTFSLSGTE